MRNGPFEEIHVLSRPRDRNECSHVPYTYPAASHFIPILEFAKERIRTRETSLIVAPNHSPKPISRLLLSPGKYSVC